MRKCVVYILGTSFSGSSLLNCLLDTQPGVRGLGEAVHFLKDETTAWCAACQVSVADCQTKRQIDRQRFYECLFQRYPDADFLVNSSKTWKLCFQESPLPPRTADVKVIVLSKSPHEFAQSYATHYQCDYERSFNIWVEFYSEIYARLAEACLYGQRVVDSRTPWPLISSHDVLLLTYRQIAGHVVPTMRRTCEFLDRPLVEDRLDWIWESDTCTIGGNMAIYAQRVKNAEFFRNNADYLNGKYGGREQQIFVDQAWRQNPDLIEACQRLYRALSPKTRKLIQWLGHDSLPNLGAEVPR